jgi:hypothetical protein
MFVWQRDSELEWLDEPENRLSLALPFLLFHLFASLCLREQVSHTISSLAPCLTFTPPFALCTKRIAASGDYF